VSRQPNEYWLKYMLVFSGATRAQIRSTAEMYRLVPPELDYLRELNAQLDLTKPRPFRGDSAISRGWTRRQRIMSLAREDPHALEARTLLVDNKVRPILEALIMAGMEPASIAQYVHLITKRNYSAETVDKYRHYFWNRDLLTVAEWWEYLARHPSGKTLMSCHHLGEEYALWSVGYRVEVTKEQALQLILHESVMRFAELGTFPNGIKTATAARFWAENTFKAIETLDKTGDSVKQVVAELRSISIRLGRRDITSIESKRLAKPEVQK
jgi:hypothetical protein